MKGKVDVAVWQKGMNLGLERLSAVHVCRSGCWVPPWLDGSFTGFLRPFKGNLVPLQHGEWNPLVRRWNRTKMAQAKKHMIARGNFICTSVKSTDFARILSESQASAKMEKFFRFLP